MLPPANSAPSRVRLEAAPLTVPPTSPRSKAMLPVVAVAALASVTLSVPPPVVNVTSVPAVSAPFRATVSSPLPVASIKDVPALIAPTTVIFAPIAPVFTMAIEVAALSWAFRFRTSAPVPRSTRTEALVLATLPVRVMLSAPAPPVIVIAPPEVMSWAA